MLNDNLIKIHKKLMVWSGFADLEGKGSLNPQVNIDKVLKIINKLSSSELIREFTDDDTTEKEMLDIILIASGQINSAISLLQSEIQRERRLRQAIRN